MPFAELNVEESRFALCRAVDDGLMNVSEAARWQGVSRKTAYKWLMRFRAGEELCSRSRARHSQGGRVPNDVEERVLQLREENPGRGPTTIRALLGREFDRVPARSTVGDILKRNGMINPRRRRRRIQPYSRPFLEVSAPNDLWTIDFKGRFKVGNNTKPLEPLTVQDSHSRFLLKVEIVPTTSERYVRPILEEAFKRYGLPKAIRSDNGVPFVVPTSRLGLSKLSVWWTSLGILHERIDLGKPQQNGRHERMHGVLKTFIGHKKPKTRSAAIEAVKDFVVDYNEVRPHQALRLETPASCYRPASKKLHHAPKDFEYPASWLTRRVFANGKFSWRDKETFVSKTLHGKTIALEPLGADRYRVHYGNAIVAIFDAATRTVLTTSQRPRR